MKEENRKEILIKETIIKDAKNIATSKYMLPMILVLFGVVIEIIVMYSFGLTYTENILVLLVSLFVLLFVIFKYAKVVAKISNDEIVITKDVLISCEDGCDQSITTVTRPVGTAFLNLFSNESKFALNFKCYGTFRIPKGVNYQESKMYSMDAKGVYNYSVVGDEFYLVVIDNKILYVYNTKLFELQE